MTSVYSGGLVYEYSEEGSKYGLVTINSPTSVTEGPDFLALQSALASQPPPTGDGGYNATGGASGCPLQSSNWNVTNDALPAIPVAAANLMKAGAGKGAGLTGAGSQNAGGSIPGGLSAGTATAGSGSVTATATSAASGTKKNAGSALQPIDKTPMIVGFVVMGFSLLGATLL
jgi:hypothetical protein